MLRQMMCYGAVLLIAVAVVGTAAPVTITADAVTLRAAADAHAESVGTVARGTVLQLTGKAEGDWVQVEAPASSAVYIYGTLVENGVVAVNSVQVRSGPGIGYRGLGAIPRGTVLDIRERIGDWLSIAPPAGMVQVWMERKYAAAQPTVAPPPPSVPRPPVVREPEAPVSAVVAPAPPQVTQAPPPVAPPAPVERVTPAVREPVAGSRQAEAAPADTVWVRPPAHPLIPARPPAVVATPRPLVDEGAVTLPNAAAAAARLYLVEGAPQGQRVTLRGVVRPAGLSWFRPSAFRLVSPRGTMRVETLCYLYTRPRILSESLGRSVRLSGRRYWVQGVRYPVVIPESFIVE